MPMFVLEIGTEELPSRFLTPLMTELAQKLDAELTEANLDHAPVRTLSTPRRLVAMVDDLAQVQPSQEVEVTGPPAAVAYKDGALTKAGEGFARGQGIDPAALYTVTTPKGEYIAGRKMTGGGTAADILPDMLARVVAGLSFPKKMHWGAYEVGFGRPVRWLLALLDEAVVEFSFGPVASGRRTHGHRVMGAGPFEVATAADYRQTVREKGRVVLDPQRRANLVRTLGEAAAGEAGGSVVWEDSLMEEVIGLVEHPLPLLGDFDPKFLELPRQVLLTSMESHQKSFGVQDAKGNLLPHFLTVLNLEPADPENGGESGEALVKKGWERVLRARLEDGMFFWKTDLGVDFDAWLAKLDKVTFLAALGSMGAKARRISRLAGALAEQVDPRLVLDAGQAGLYAKADLVSEMVGEFDTLQGVMGSIYARKKGYSEQIAEGIGEHYLPTGPDSPVPASTLGALVAVADKADSLAGIFGLNMAPTGAADPYALRRAALGICRILLEHDLRLSLTDLLSRARQGYGPDVDFKLDQDEALAKLQEFFNQRLKALYVAKGYETLVVEAALAAGHDDLPALDKRLAALADFSKSQDFDQAVLTFKRAANIIRKQGGDGVSAAYDEKLFEHEAEAVLGKALAELGPRFDELWAADDYPALFGLLGELRPAVDGFFDNVMVMAEDEAVRANRMGLLKTLVDKLARLADFAALQV